MFVVAKLQILFLIPKFLGYFAHFCDEQSHLHKV